MSDKDRMDLLDIATEIEVVDDPADAEGCVFVVCMKLTSPLLVPDNEINLCSECGEAVQHRPHIPKRPKLICHPCMKGLLKDGDELTAKITPRTAAELAAFIHKKSLN